MKKTQFFYETGIAALQEKVNGWLAENPKISVTHSNLDVIARPSLAGNTGGSDLFTFYLLYETHEMEMTQAQVLQEVASAADDVVMPKHVVMPADPAVQLQ